LDASALRAACLEKLHLASTTLAGSWRGLFCVEFRVCGLTSTEVDDMEAAELSAFCQGDIPLAVHRMVLSPRGEMLLPHRFAAPLDTASGVVWWWVIPVGGSVNPQLEQSQRLETAAVVNMCRLRLGKRSVWTQEDIPADEIMRQANSLSVTGQLPDEWFFNGSCYVRVDGYEQKHHPDLPGRLDLLLREHNAAVEAWNRTVDEVSHLPMFMSPSIIT